MVVVVVVVLVVSKNILLVTDGYNNLQLLAKTMLFRSFYPHRNNHSVFCIIFLRRSYVLINLCVLDVPSWIMEMRQLLDQIQERHQQEEQRLQQSIYSQEFILHGVNISVANFMFDTGIRRYLREEATRLGIRGFTRRMHHGYIRIQAEGTTDQLRRFRTLLGDHLRRGLYENMEAHAPVHLTDGHMYENFIIMPNEHIRCDRNDHSNGDEWEKKSSSVGSSNTVLNFG